jgi:hypothetical protein
MNVSWISCFLFHCQRMTAYTMFADLLQHSVRSCLADISTFPINDLISFIQQNHIHLTVMDIRRCHPVVHNQFAVNINLDMVFITWRLVVFLRQAGLKIFLSGLVLTLISRTFTRLICLFLACPVYIFPAHNLEGQGNKPKTL